MQSRQLKTLLICLIVVITILVKPVMVFGASSVITVSADKTEAKPGDIITFSVILGPVSNMGTMQMQLVIPDGLSFVSGSGKLADGLKGTLGFDTANFVESNKFINGYASSSDYSSGTDTLICTFECEVKADYSGTAEVSLTNLEFYSCETWEDHTDEFSAGKAIVKVVAEHLPDDSEDPGQQTDPTPGDTEDPGQQTDPTPSGNEDPGQQTDPAPGGNEDPGQQTDPTPGGNENPGQQTDPTPGGSEDSSQQTDPTPSGNEEPRQQTDPASPEDTTPNDPEQSDNTSPDDSSPKGNDTPSGSNNEQNKSGDGGQDTPDPDTSDTNKVPGDNEDSPKTDNDSKDSDDRSEGGFPWWAVFAAVALAIVVLLIILKRRNNKKKVIDTLN